MDPNYSKLAGVLTGFSTNLQKGERVLIDAFDIPEAMVVALVRAARDRGAVPYVNLQNARVSRELVMGVEPDQYEAQCAWELSRMQKMDAYIAVRGSDNIFEMSDVDPAKVSQVMRAMKPVLDHRVNKTKWVILRWPTPAMAQQAMKSTDSFEEFFFRVCTQDYSRMTEGMAALEALMKATDKVELKGPNTDLRFSIKGIGAVACGGRHNIPDGEVFSCPVRDSVEGEIIYNAPTVYQGTSFDRIHLKFEKGKIVYADGTNPDRLNDILNSDAGARYIGEFAIGFNPHILEPMRDILFDEKIAGSFHFTPGQAYEECDNGNRSQVHWDMVQIQRPEYGGGEIWFDGELIRKDGLFVKEALKKLNPDYLLG
ncbi:aminopeptidase [Coraliomargarita parva]|uniref:aminopeptidase n=1 Tax=Coraliomargarita parva TaxID=3014050 RepID=UPI0022B473E5|nr:aminopeptidase [Coraliomargarita parva]